jgi:integrase
MENYSFPFYPLLAGLRLGETLGVIRIESHTATILLGMGVHPKIVQELLGHSNISMTMDIYSHVLPSMQQETMDKLDDLFKGNE